MAAGVCVFSRSLKPDQLWNSRGKKRTDGEMATCQSDRSKRGTDKIPPAFGRWLVLMCSLGSADRFHSSTHSHLSFFIIIFPRSMESQLIMLHVCMSPWMVISAGSISTVSAVWSRRQNKTWHVDYCWSYRIMCSIGILPPLLNWHYKQNWRRCCDFCPSIINQNTQECLSFSVVVTSIIKALYIQSILRIVFSITTQI